MARSTRITASLPLDSFDAFKALTEAQRTAIVGQIAKDRDGGLSGNQLREKFGSWLTGPRRCKLLHANGHGSVVGATYEEYNDDAQTAPLVGGKRRTGSRHAKYHGQGTAASKRREEIKAQAEAAMATTGKRLNRKRSPRKAAAK